MRIILIILILTSFVHADVSVLCYHRIIQKPKYIYDVAVVEFEKQIKTLLDNRYRIIRISDLLDGIEKKNIPEKAVIITVDDGDISSYESAYRIAKKYRIPITLFIYTDYISRGGRSISWEKLEELAKAGVDIGSHTRTHPYLTKLKNIKMVEKEIKESKDIIEDKLKIKVKFFAYPYGLYNNVIEDIVIKSGYESALTLDWGNNDLNTNRFRIKRKLVLSNMNIKKFMDIVAGR